MKNKKTYYHVVMHCNATWLIVESKHKNPSMVKNSINSYVNYKHAKQNISDPNSRHYGVVKKFWK
jgi:hypothetical protein